MAREGGDERPDLEFLGGVDDGDATTHATMERIGRRWFTLPLLAVAMLIAAVATASFVFRGDGQEGEKGATPSDEPETAAPPVLNRSASTTTTAAPMVVDEEPAGQSVERIRPADITTTTRWQPSGGVVLPPMRLLMVTNAALVVFDTSSGRWHDVELDLPLGSLVGAAIAPLGEGALIATQSELLVLDRDLMVQYRRPHAIDADQRFVRSGTDAAMIVEARWRPGDQELHFSTINTAAEVENFAPAHLPTFGSLPKLGPNGPLVATRDGGIYEVTIDGSRRVAEGQLIAATSTGVVRYTCGATVTDCRTEVLDADYQPVRRLGDEVGFMFDAIAARDLSAIAGWGLSGPELIRVAGGDTIALDQTSPEDVGAFSPDGAWFLATGHRELRLFEVSTGLEHRIPLPGDHRSSELGAGPTVAILAAAGS